MKAIFITEQDRQRLNDCLAVLHEYADGKDLRHVQQLEEEISRASIIVDPTSTPGDVVTMRSRVRVRDIDTGKESVYTLVYPSESDPMALKVSVLAPIGAALLGCRVGDVVERDIPKGRCRFMIEELIYQPEAAGDYHL